MPNGMKEAGSTALACTREWEASASARRQHRVFFDCRVNLHTKRFTHAPWPRTVPKYNILTDTMSSKEQQLV
eukprot:1639199-Amphidinium_carterae.1